MSDPRYRKHLRLPEYDYGQAGNYYFTICTANRACTLGSVHNGEVHLSIIGEIVHKAWLALPTHHSKVILDEMVIMPNHVHGIVSIVTDPDGVSLESTRSLSESARFSKRRAKGPAKGALGAILGSFKSASSREINKYRHSLGAPVWQPNYFEHIIRDEPALERLRTYIAGNPARWDYDSDNPALAPGSYSSDASPG